MANIDRVAKTEHCISEAFEVGLAISEVSGRLLQPLTEPLSVLRRLPVSVGGHKKYTDWLVGALHGKVNTMDKNKTLKHNTNAFQQTRKEGEKLYLAFLQ